MANIKQQKKRVLQDKNRRLRNMDVKSRMKTCMKQALTAISAGNKDEVGKVLPVALSAIDRAASKGVIHANSAARKKSSLMTRASALQ